MRSICLSGLSLSFLPSLLFLPGFACTLTVILTCLVQNSALSRPVSSMHAIQERSVTLQSVLRGSMQASC